MAGSGDSQCPWDLYEDQGHLGVKAEAQRADAAGGRERCRLGLWVEALELPEENADLGSGASKPQPAWIQVVWPKGTRLLMVLCSVLLRSGDHRHRCSPIKVLLG